MTKLHLIEGGKDREEQRETWRTLVRKLAGEQCGIDPAALTIETGSGGKPFLSGCPEFHFSVSHTRGLLVVAASGRAVGVDCEKLRPTRIKLAERFFTPSERDWVRAVPGEQEERFFAVWTRKEAYLKYTGTGIRVPLGSFDVIDGSLPVRMDTFVWQGYAVSCCYSEHAQA